MKKWFLPILSGIFLVLSYPPFNIKVLPFFALLPLFFFLSSKDISHQKSFSAGFLTGFIFFSGIISWIFDLLPLDWIGIENKAAGFLIIFFFWLLLVLISAFCFGIFSLACHFLRRKNSLNILLVPSLWILLEYLRCWFFAIITFGKESLFGPHWTYGNLAYSLAQNSNFRFLAGIGGIYLVSFLIVLINILIFLLFKKLWEIRFSIVEKNVKAVLPYFIAVLIIISFISTTYFVSFLRNRNQETQALKVAVLQTKIPSVFSPTKKMLEGKFQIQNQLLKKTLQFSFIPDIIILPEGSRFFEYQTSREILNELFPRKETFIIDSYSTETFYERKSTAVFYSTQEGFLAYYQKLLLAPTGEYFPYIIKIPAQIVNKKWAEKLERSKGFKKGSDVTVFSSSNGWRGSISFCSEPLSSILFRQMAQKNSQIFFNLASLAFSHGSRTLDSQIQAILQFRAAENGRYSVRATNYGSSYIIDEKGEIVKKTQDSENQILLGEAKLFSQKTFYTRYGDWVLILAGFLLLTFCFFVLKYKKKIDL